ncbi:MAG: hypothetical protein ACHQ49_08020 [Elusimicrobiota bacterium]
MMRQALLLAALAAAAVPCRGADALSGAQDQADAAVQTARSSRASKPMEGADLARADHVETSPGRSGRLAVRIRFEQGSRFLPVPNLVFRAVGASQPAAATDAAGETSFDGCSSGDSIEAAAELGGDYFKIRPLLARRISVRGACGTDVTLSFARANPAASALRVWRVAGLAKSKLDAEVGASAWPQGVVFDVFSGAATTGERVGIGGDDTTFVVGHELGHAVSDHAGMIQQGFGDSYHQMTACIGDSAALEEGWASFFGAWADQGPDAPDPIQEWDQRSFATRRLPIKTVPDEVEIGPRDHPQIAQVCRGTDNEMRVMSFLWNVVAADGAHASFGTLWRALAGGRLTSVSQVALNLQKLGVDATALRRIWDAAFKTPPPL